MSTHTLKKDGESFYVINLFRYVVNDFRSIGSQVGNLYNVKDRLTSTQDIPTLLDVAKVIVLGHDKEITLDN